jgi:demethylspheroidene O-methyltransferase
MIQPSTSLSWLDRCLAIRDGLLSSARFKHWAAAFPLTRPLARRRARQVFDLCAGFVYSQVLQACIRLNLFDILAQGPQTAAALSSRLTLSLDSTVRLLNAAVSLQLVSRRGQDRFGLGELGAALVGNEAVTAMVKHHAVFYSDLQDPVALLRRDQTATGLSRYWPYSDADSPASLGQESVGAYTALMANSQSLVSTQILDAYPMDKHRCLLDVGGGDGSFIAAAAMRLPQLQFMLFDLPMVVDRARPRFSTSGLAGRVQIFGGSFLTDPLPGGADIVSLVRVIHDHDDDSAIAILRAVRRALPKDGVVLVAEPMSGIPGTEAVADAYFGFYLLAMGRGKARTPAQLGALLKTAGFEQPRLFSTHLPLQASLMAARTAC